MTISGVSARIGSLTTNGEVLSYVVVDAGPFIALFNLDDRDHHEAVRGFRHLSAGRVRLVVPLPIVFEVYKWLLYNVSADAARSALTQIKRLTQITYPSSADFERAARTVHALPEWVGSLEDALLAWTALTMRVPLWTLNHRDFGAFPELSFWSPR